MSKFQVIRDFANNPPSREEFFKAVTPEMVVELLHEHDLLIATLRSASRALIDAADTADQV